MKGLHSSPGSKNWGFLEYFVDEQIIYKSKLLQRLFNLCGNMPEKGN